jgi:SAM-dependent methyltransferase
MIAAGCSRGGDGATMAGDHASFERIYADRPLSANYPDLTGQGTRLYDGAQAALEERKVAEAAKLVADMRRVVRLPQGARLLVVGTGPRPVLLRELARLGFRVEGVEPVRAYVAAANGFLGGSGSVRPGSAERTDLPDAAFDAVILESVMEHVDSPLRSLEEAFRLLRPGGLLFVTTTNRWRFSWRGENGEYNVPFYNYLPAVVKEAYVNQHLLYEPRLANHTPRPAVHWYSYARLCELGRTAGFAQFYSIIDLMPTGEGWRGRLRRLVKFNPWLRALALLQFGFTVFMVKRGEDADAGAGEAAT